MKKSQPFRIKLTTQVHKPSILARLMLNSVCIALQIWEEITLKSAHRKCWLMLLVLWPDGTMTVCSLYPAEDSGPQSRAGDVYTAVLQQGQSLTWSGLTALTFSREESEFSVGQNGVSGRFYSSCWVSPLMVVSIYLRIFSFLKYFPTCLKTIWRSREINLEGKKRNVSG